MLGKPTVAGTRLTVELILERLAAGEGIDRVVESYPRLDGESVGGALLFAAGRVEEMLARLGLTEEPLVDAVTALNEAGWLKALKLDGYAPRRPAGPMILQGVLFPYPEALKGRRTSRGTTFADVGDPLCRRPTRRGRHLRCPRLSNPCLGMGGKSVDLGPVPMR